MSAGFHYSPPPTPSAGGGGMVETMWATTVADFPAVTGTQAYQAQWGSLTSFGADPPILGGVGNDTVVVEAAGYHIVTLSGSISANLAPGEDFVAYIQMTGSNLVIEQYVPFVHTGTIATQAITPLTLGVYFTASVLISAQVLVSNLATSPSAQLGLSLSRIGTSLDTSGHSPIPL